MYVVTVSNTISLTVCIFHCNTDYNICVHLYNQCRTYIYHFILFIFILLDFIYRGSLFRTTLVLTAFSQRLRVIILSTQRTQLVAILFNLIMFVLYLKQRFGNYNCLQRNTRIKVTSQNTALN